MVKSDRQRDLNEDLPKQKNRSVLIVCLSTAARPLPSYKIGEGGDFV